MVKNGLKIVSVLAFSLSLNSYAEAGKNSIITEEKKRPPLPPKKSIPKNKGRLIRPDGSYNMALSRHLIRALFQEDVQD